jgi:hypothetical protein
LLAALAIEDAAAAAAATAIVLLWGRGRGVAHMMHASPRSFSFTMVQAPHSHDDDMMLEWSSFGGWGIQYYSWGHYFLGGFF